jgi:hypothetical protein
VLVQLSLRVEQNMLKVQLGEESTLGLIPVEHLRYIPYTSRRKMAGWLPSFVDRTDYIRAATRLAFRKSQYPFCTEAQRQESDAEIARLRERIRRLLNPAGPEPPPVAISATSPIIE